MLILPLFFFCLLLGNRLQSLQRISAGCQIILTQPSKIPIGTRVENMDFELKINNYLDSDLSSLFSSVLSNQSRLYSFYLLYVSFTGGVTCLHEMEATKHTETTALRGNKSVFKSLQALLGRGKGVTRKAEICVHCCGHDSLFPKLLIRQRSINLSLVTTTIFKITLKTRAI